jgi:hypothetical protein
MPDRVLARLHGVAVQTVANRRRALGIDRWHQPPAPPPEPRAPAPLPAWLDVAELGVVRDSELARRWGVWPGRIGYWRKKLGIGKAGRTGRKPSDPDR